MESKVQKCEATFLWWGSWWQSWNRNSRVDSLHSCAWFVRASLFFIVNTTTSFRDESAAQTSLFSDVNSTAWHLQDQWEKLRKQSVSLEEGSCPLGFEDADLVGSPADSGCQRCRSYHEFTLSLWASFFSCGLGPQHSHSYPCYHRVGWLQFSLHLAALFWTKLEFLQGRNCIPMPSDFFQLLGGFQVKFKQSVW